MRNGLRAWDADTHVNPAAEVLERYVDPSFRPRLPELAQHRHATSQIGGTAGTHQYRVGTKSYRRVLGQASAHETFTGRGHTRLAQIEHLLKTGQLDPQLFWTVNP